MDRRLPVYIVVDTSESMVGEPISSVASGINSLLDALRSNPQALETVWLSVIAFAGKAKQVSPLTEIWKFRAPTFGIGPGTSLGKALTLLCESIDREVVNTSATQKGDWKPIAFLLTDGQPTDAWAKSADRLKKYSANVIAVGCGPDADLSVLSGITPNVLSMTGTTKDDFARFFKWVSASVSTTSTQLGREGQPITLPEMPEGVVQPYDSQRTHSGKPSQVILAAKCRRSGAPYLMRYRSTNGSSAYSAEGAYSVDHDYFAESQNGHRISVNTSLLDGSPKCPDCGEAGWAMCSCGGLFCSPEEGGTLKCPHCGKTDHYRQSNFDVRRTIG